MPRLRAGEVEKAAEQARAAAAAFVARAPMCATCA